MDQTIHDPKGDSLLSRALRPMLLLAPLTVGLLLAGAVYGWRSSQLAAEIDSLAPFLVVNSPDGARMAPDRLCPDARGDLAELTFHRLDPDDPSRKSSLSGLGFDQGVIDLKGWLEAPTGNTDPGGRAGTSTDEASGSVEATTGDDQQPEAVGGSKAAASDPAAQDNRDEITLELRRSNETWCVTDVAVR